MALNLPDKHRSIRSFQMLIAVVFLVFTNPSMVSARVTPDIGELALPDLMWIGEEIFQKECGGRKDRLLWWNRGEDFPSLGIGHFIWYPKGKEGPFEESFPAFLRFARERGIRIPRFLSATPAPHCPWNNRKAFFRARNTRTMKSLYTFLVETRHEQTLFIVRRLQAAIPRIMEAASEERRDHIRTQLFRVGDSPRSLYALIDYVNFKGEGLKSTERYNDQGWGLLQVLEEMSGSEPGPEAIHDFVRAAESVLLRRVWNAPPYRNEERWFPGWKNRVHDYKNLALSS